MYKRWIGLLVGLTIGLAAACGGNGGETEIHTDSFVMGESTKIVVNGDNGSMMVTPSTDGTVTVQSIVKRPDQVEYQIKKEGNTIRIDAESRGSGIFDFRESPGVDVVITAPDTSIVELETSNGRIDVSGMHRSGIARTSNSEVNMNVLLEVLKSPQATGAWSLLGRSGHSILKLATAWLSSTENSSQAARTV